MCIKSSRPRYFIGASTTAGHEVHISNKFMELQFDKARNSHYDSSSSDTQQLSSSAQYCPRERLRFGLPELHLFWQRFPFTPQFIHISLGVLPLGGGWWYGKAHVEVQVFVWSCELVCIPLPSLVPQLLESMVQNWGGLCKEVGKQQLVDKFLVILANLWYTGAITVLGNI